MLVYQRVFILTFYLAISDILSGIYFDILSDILSGIYSDILSAIFSGILSGICSDILSDILSGICTWHIFWHSFWHCIWYIFEDSLWSLWLRRGPLRSSACSWGPAGTTAIKSLLSGPAWFTFIQCLLFGSGGDHCNHELAVEVAEEEEDEEAGGTADTTSNNPHLTGEEKTEDVNRQNGLVSGIHQGTCSKNRAKVRCAGTSWDMVQYHGTSPI